MRRFILAGTAIAALAALAVPTLASADVQRDETATLTSTVNGTYTHTYNITIAPDGSFTGTGSVGAVSETITSGKIAGSNIISFTATYNDGSGYTWNDTGTTGTDSMNQSLTVSNVLSNVTTNHGQYVSSQGGGATAAQSLIGMPTNSNK